MDPGGLPAIPLARNPRERAPEAQSTVQNIRCKGISKNSVDFVKVVKSTPIQTQDHRGKGQNEAVARSWQLHPNRPTHRAATPGPGSNNP